MAGSKRSLSPIARPLDDLTAITGIGVARQRWLHETMGVSSYADLAAIDPVTVEARLREEGKIIAPGDIQTWIDQATDLASLQTPANVIPDSASGVWQPIASFVVEYQRRGDLYRTRLHQMETGQGKTFDGLVVTPICEWIEAQSGFARQTPEDVSASPMPASTEPFQFSSRLQQLLEKAGTPVTVPSITAITVPPANVNSAQVRPTAEPFSSRLQELIERTRRT